MSTAVRPCTGSLQEKNGIWYTVIQVTVNGKRKSKWQTTHLKVRGNKRKAQALLEERKAQYELLYMSGEGGSLDDCRPEDLLFSDYLLRWTLTQKGNVSFATNQCRERMLKGRMRRDVLALGPCYTPASADQVHSSKIHRGFQHSIP